MNPRSLCPHPSCDIVLFCPDCIRIDCGGGELGVPEPALQQIKRDAGLDRRYSESAPQPRRGCLRPLDASEVHNREHFFKAVVRPKSQSGGG